MFGCCDGSGYFEQYVDVDQTWATPCPGCPECDEETVGEYRFAAAVDVLDEMRESLPLWADAVYFDTPRRPVLPELPADFRFIELTQTA